MTLPVEFLAPITPEAINALPIRRYDGPVHLVRTAEMLEEAAAQLAREPVVGFDTETRPAFRVGQRYAPALAQVATGRGVYLFQLARLDCAATLGALLSSPTVKAGVGIGDDIKALRETFAFTPAAVVDLGGVARRHGLERSGVRALAALFLGIRIPKGAKTSNWAARELSPAQIAYAATDAWVCRELYLRFEEMRLLSSAAARGPRPAP